MWGGVTWDEAGQQRCIRQILAGKETTILWVQREVRNSYPTIALSGDGSWQAGLLASVWYLFKDILKQPVVIWGAIMSENWANVGFWCHQLSIIIGFIIRDRGASVSLRMFYPPDFGGRMRGLQFQGHLVIFGNWKIKCISSNFLSSKVKINNCLIIFRQNAILCQHH